MITVVTWRTCPDCHGLGKIPDKYVSHDRDTCPECGNRGGGFGWGCGTCGRELPDLKDAK